MKSYMGFLPYRIAILFLSLFFFTGCSDDGMNEILPTGDTPGMVWDVDGNQYRTVAIGEQIWMAENLRTTRYADGTYIPTGLNQQEWLNWYFGAYDIYDHTAEEAMGIDSPEEMVAAYGKLYNWYATKDSRGLCPEGWRVADFRDWSQLWAYLRDEFGYHNNLTSDDVLGVGNALKSCRQVDSPLGGGCNTTEHPRWNASNNHYGFDAVGFSALPGGDRTLLSKYVFLGSNVSFWTATETSNLDALLVIMFSGFGSTYQISTSKLRAASIRCIRKDDP